MGEKKRGRPKNEEPTVKVEPRLPPGVFACLKWLANKNRYGSTPTEIAKYLIVRGVDDWDRAGMFKDMEGD